MSETINPRFTRRQVLQVTAGAVAFAALASNPLAALAQTAASGQPLKIATIGAGREGKSLGTLFVKAGHDVMFSSRHPEELKEFVAGLGAKAQAGTVADAVAFGDVILLIVPFTAIADIAKEHGAALAKKQLVVDVSNPIARRDGEDFVKKVNDDGGAGVVTGKALPGAHLVRGFNAIGSGQLEQLAHRQGDPVGVPIAGDDQAALTLASRLINEIGFDPVVVGGLAMGKYLVPGTPLGGVHTPAELKQIASTLKA
jgi:predicted dinucleotide-binding enzyme